VGARRAVTIFVAAASLLSIGITDSHSRASAARARPATAPTTAARPPFGVFGDYQPIVGDFNGDGRADIFWYGLRTSSSAVWFGAANRQFTKVREVVHGRGYVPVVLDRNADGRDDILWSRVGDAVQPVWWGNADGMFSHHSLYAPGLSFTTVVGDFNGDGHDDILWDAPDRATTTNGSPTATAGSTSR
jgi:hypothetical protein